MNSRPQRGKLNVFLVAVDDLNSRIAVLQRSRSG
jgi:hypothetical protein